jgi:hypothetical protein
VGPYHGTRGVVHAHLNHPDDVCMMLHQRVDIIGVVLLGEKKEVETTTT